MQGLLSKNILLERIYFNAYFVFVAELLDKIERAHVKIGRRKQRATRISYHFEIAFVIK
jgi:hypothetical protein